MLKKTVWRVCLYVFIYTNFLRGGNCLFWTNITNFCEADISLISSVKCWALFYDAIREFSNLIETRSTKLCGEYMHEWCKSTLNFAQKCVAINGHITTCSKVRCHDNILCYAINLHADINHRRCFKLHLVKLGSKWRKNYGKSRRKNCSFHITIHCHCRFITGQKGLLANM